MSGTSFLPEYGGPAVSVSRLARAVARQGISVMLWAPDGSAQSLSSEFEGLMIEACSGTLSEVLAGKQGIDLVHDNGIWLSHNHAIARAARDLGATRVVTPRGMLEPWALSHRFIKKRLAWALYQKRDLNRADALHCTADIEAHNVSRLRLKTECVVIPNGVDLSPELENQPGQAFRIDQEPDRTSKEGKKRMVFMSRLHPVKGIPMLLEAWARIAPREWELLIAGPTEAGYDREVLQQIDRLDLARDVRYIGPVCGANKRNLILSADVFVLPTHSENFGLVIAEALALERPVLTTTGAPWELLLTEQCGWWVEPTLQGIHDGLVAAMSASRAERRAMGKRGRSAVTDRFNWDKIGSDMVALYNAVLARQSGDARSLREIILETATFQSIR